MSDTTSISSRAKGSLAARGLRQKIISFDEFGVVAGLLAISLVLTIASPEKFPTATNLLLVTRQAASMGILALGMVFVISMGDIDLQSAYPSHIVLPVVPKL